MATELGAVIARDLDVAGIDARLVEAAAAGEKLEVVLVLRGSVRRAAGSSRWRIRVAGGRIVTFAAEWVVAATHLSRPRR
jgi:hypothetical protein